jgi:hypothetical protein
VKRIVRMTGLGLAVLAYLWVAAVRAAPGVRRRKAAARAGARR